MMLNNRPLLFVLNLFSPKHQLAATLRARQSNARRLAPLSTYRAVSPITGDVDPKSLANLQVTPGNFKRETAVFADRVQESLAHIVSQSTSIEYIDLTSIDGCSDSRDELSARAYRTLRDWGSRLTPPFYAQGHTSPHDQIHACLKHSFPTHATKPIEVYDLLWSRHPRYWLNGDGSHHAAYAIFTAAARGITQEIQAKITRFQVNADTVARLEQLYGAYVMTDTEWGAAMGWAQDAPYQVSFAQVNGRGVMAVNTTRIWFLDPQHPLTPTARDALMRLTANKCARTLSEWINEFSV